jgi:hypothetical protein
VRLSFRSFLLVEKRKNKKLMMFPELKEAVSPTWHLGLPWWLSFLQGEEQGLCLILIVTLSYPHGQV